MAWLLCVYCPLTVIKYSPANYSFIQLHALPLTEQNEKRFHMLPSSPPLGGISHLMSSWCFRATYGITWKKKPAGSSTSQFSRVVRNSVSKSAHISPAACACVCVCVRVRVVSSASVVLAWVCALHRRREIWVDCEAAADAPVRGAASAAGCRVGCCSASSLLRALLRLSLLTEENLLLQQAGETTRYRHRQYLVFLASSLKHYDRRNPPGLRLLWGHFWPGAAGEIWNLIGVFSTFNAPLEIIITRY